MFQDFHKNIYNNIFLAWL